MTIRAHLRFALFLTGILTIVAFLLLSRETSPAFRRRLTTLPVPIPFLSPSSNLRGEVLFLGKKNAIDVYRVDFTTVDTENLATDRIYLVYVNSLTSGGVPIETMPLDHAITLFTGSRYDNYFGYEYVSQDGSVEFAHQNDTVFAQRFPGKFFASQRARDEDAQHSNDIANFEGLNGVTFLPTSSQTNGVRLEPSALYVVVTNEPNGSVVTLNSPPLCGDGWKRIAEACDDGNTLASDGCSPVCTVEAGWQCSGNPSVCTRLAVCGNGQIESGESCDDANAASGDGCSPACQVESGWSCTGQPSVCTQNPVLPACGNGLIEAGESCDDGNAAGGDGCSASCQVESGFSCVNQPSVCALLCGNGVINAGEECDDGNQDQTDSCRMCTIYPPLPFGSPSAHPVQITQEAFSGATVGSGSAVIFRFRVAAQQDVRLTDLSFEVPSFAQTMSGGATLWRDTNGDSILDEQVSSLFDVSPDNTLHISLATRVGGPVVITAGQTVAFGVAANVNPSAVGSFAFNFATVNRPDSYVLGQFVNGATPLVGIQTNANPCQPASPVRCDVGVSTLPLLGSVTVTQLPVAGGTFTAGQANVTVARFSVNPRRTLDLTSLSFLLQSSNQSVLSGAALWADTNGDGIVDQQFSGSYQHLADGTVIFSNFSGPMGAPAILADQTVIFEVHANLAPVPTGGSFSFAFDTSQMPDRYFQGVFMPEFAPIRGIVTNGGPCLPSALASCEAGITTVPSPVWGVRGASPSSSSSSAMSQGSSSASPPSSGSSSQASSSTASSSSANSAGSSDSSAASSSTSSLASSVASSAAASSVASSVASSLASSVASSAASSSAGPPPPPPPTPSPAPVVTVP